MVHLKSNMYELCCVDGGMRSSLVDKYTGIEKNIFLFSL